MYYEIDGFRLRVLGTNHVVPEGRPLPDFVHRAIAWAEAACTEHNPADFQQKTTLSNGVSLQSLLPASTWTALHAAWRGDDETLQRLKPWAAALNVGISRLRFSPGVEPALSRKLVSLNRLWGTIEHGHEVADLLDAVPVADVAKSLMIALPEIERSQEHFEVTYDGWASRDEEDLVAGMSQAPLFMQPSIRKAFLTERNRRWADRVLAFGPLAVDTVLAVGCFHLIGEGNFIDELRARGLRVQALP